LKLTRYSKLLIACIAIVLAVSLLFFSSAQLFQTPPEAPEAPAVTSTPTPTLTPETKPTTAAPTPSPSPMPTSTIQPWPASNQPPPEVTQPIATSNISDQAGDADEEVDITYAEVTQIDATHLRFSMTLAENIPSPYTLCYGWVLDADMNASTGWKGYGGVDYTITIGVPPIYVTAGEHWVVAWLDSSLFSPPNTQIQPHNIPWSQVTVVGKTITVTIELADIGNPNGIYWQAHATSQHSNDENPYSYDHAPNQGFVSLATVPPS
jgi:hypothetical protein